MTEFVKSRRKKNLLDLAGQIQQVPGFDHKALRKIRHTDRDFETIVQVRPLQNLQFQSGKLR